MLSTRWIMRMSPMTGVNSTSGNFSSNSSRMLCIGVSALSNRTNCFSPKWQSCRQSSLPMEPAAPVTKTTLPFREPAISSMLIRISSRPNRSSMRTSGRARIFSLPPFSSSKEGRSNIRTFSFSQKRTRRSLSSFTAL